MQTLFVQETPRDGRRTSIQRVASVVLHLVLLAAFTFQVHKVVKVVARPHKVAAVIIPYAPGHQAVVQKPRPKVQPPKDPPKLPLKQPDPPPVSSGGDPTGEDDVSVATADFYPDPKPDLAMLPHGTNGDVVVDIVIDESGKVVETTLDQGLGHGFDEAVMAVIQTWTFTPATKAGKPVASKQQLLFHFVRA